MTEIELQQLHSKVTKYTLMIDNLKLEILELKMTHNLCKELHDKHIKGLMQKCKILSNRNDNMKKEKKVLIREVLKLREKVNQTTDTNNTINELESELYDSDKFIDEIAALLTSTNSNYEAFLDTINNFSVDKLTQNCNQNNKNNEHYENHENGQNEHKNNTNNEYNENNERSLRQKSNELLSQLIVQIDEMTEKNDCQMQKQDNHIKKEIYHNCALMLQLLRKYIEITKQYNQQFLNGHDGHNNCNGDDTNSNDSNDEYSNDDDTNSNDETNSNYSNDSNNNNENMRNISGLGMFMSYLFSFNPLKKG